MGCTSIYDLTSNYIVSEQTALSANVRFGIKTYFISVVLLCTVSSNATSLNTFYIRYWFDRLVHPDLYSLPILFAQRLVFPVAHRKIRGSYAGHRIYGQCCVTAQHIQSPNSTSAENDDAARFYGLSSTLYTRSGHNVDGRSTFVWPWSDATSWPSVTLPNCNAYGRWHFKTLRFWGAISSSWGLD